jgi:radical SAM protein with 4Fe4S-binding SPASM domain
VKLSLSLDDFEERHDAHRGVPGAFQRVLAAYRFAEERSDGRLMADIAITVTPDNWNHVGGLYAMLREAGVRNVTAILLRAAGASQTCVVDGNVVAAYGQLAAAAEADRRRAGTFPSHHRIREAVRSEKNSVVSDVLCGRPARTGPAACFAGSLFAVLSPEGQVLPCEVLDRTWAFGNLRDADFDFGKIWHSRGATSLRSRIRKQACQCTYECAWSVNVLADRTLLPRLAGAACRSLLWDR